MDNKDTSIKVIGPTLGPNDVWFVHVQRKENGKLIYNAALPIGEKERAIKAANDLRKVLQ